MILAVYDDNNNIVAEFDIDKLNQAPSSNETSIYFATYNSDKEIVSFDLDLTGKTGYVVGEATKALPNNTNDFYGFGSHFIYNNSNNYQRQFCDCYEQ